MTTVVLYGITGGYVAEDIKRILSDYGIISIRGNSIEEKKDSPQFLIVECTTSANITANNGIIVMTGESGLKSHLKIPKGYIGIVYSSDTVALGLLEANEITTVTCGMSPTNTVTLSSVTENTASVCLQRKIVSLSGKVIEPCEWPVKLKARITDYALMAAYAILLLSDIEPDSAIL